MTWTNLGLLYYYHGDLELANEALYRAQTLDSDYSVAWFGQGLVATANGHLIDAANIFEHITTLTAALVRGRGILTTCALILSYSQQPVSNIHLESFDKEPRDQTMICSPPLQF